MELYVYSVCVRACVYTENHFVNKLTELVLDGPLKPSIVAHVMNLIPR